MGVVTTGVVGWISHQAAFLKAILENFGLMGYLVVLGLWLMAAFGLGFATARVSPAVGGGLFLGFTAITGLMISYIFWTYTGDTIILAFALTTGVFAAMSAIGCTTKRDLSGLGTMCCIGLVGVVIAGVVNWFIGK